jgi:hypothetical protein
MKIRRNFVTASSTIPWLTLAVMGSFANWVQGGFPTFDPPVPQRMALADLVVVGKVQELEPEMVVAAPFFKIRGARPLAYQIARISVDQAVIGPKYPGVLRAAFQAPNHSAPPGAASVKKNQVKLRVGQTGCFFLTKHPDESFYGVRSTADVLNRTAKDYDKDLALVKRCAHQLGDLDAGLRSTDADERLLCAAMLIFRYRTATVVYRGKPRSQPIAAERSKRILSILGEGPWSASESTSLMGRLRLFLLLGLSRQDGWIPPRSVDETRSAAQAWLRENTGTYLIQRYVPEDTVAD